MSQASKAIKEIAAGSEYTALVQAIEQSDYEKIAVAFKQLNEVIETRKNEILAKIDALPRQNKKEDRQQFLSAFNTRLATTLPEWQKLNDLIKEQKVYQGEIFATGAKGDPMVKSPEGKTVIVSGVTGEKGTVIRYRITREGEKTDFGRAIEFDKDFFYSLLNQNVLGQVWNIFNSVEERLKNGIELTPENIDVLLGDLQKVRQLAESLRPEEREGIGSRVINLRKRIIVNFAFNYAVEYINSQEEKEIAEICNGDKDKVALALTAPGIFRARTYETLKNEIFDGNRIRGYEDILKQMESHLDNMQTAMEFMEFKTGVESVAKPAREYLEKMDAFLEKLNGKLRNAAYNIAENNRIVTTEEILKSIKESLSSPSICAVLNRSFRNPGEFFALREAMAKLRLMLGHSDVMAAEEAIKPYLTRKVKIAFRRPARKTAGATPEDK